MKIFRITTNYPEYLRNFARRHPGIEARQYEDQHALLMRDRFGWADAWTHALAPIGVEAWEPVANLESAQRKWADEHSVDWDDRDWLTSVAAAQVEAFRPDVVLIDDIGSFTPAFVRELRERVSSIRLIAYWCGAPLGDLTGIAPADLVLSNLPGLVDYLNRAGKRAVLFRHAFDRRIIEEIGEPGPRRFALSFAGSIVRRANYHLQRERVLDALAKSLDISVFSSFEPPPSRQLAGGRIQRLIEPLLRRRGYVLETQAQRDAALEFARVRALEELAPELPAKLRPPVFGMDMYRVLRDSQVTVNIHIDYFGESAANMRLFEATGVGCCLLTDWKYDLAEQFTPDSEVVTFRSAGECVEKARYLVDHPELAEEIGRAGQRRTLDAHTFHHRAPELVAIFNGLM